MRDTFTFKFKDALIQGNAEVDRISKLLVPDSIVMGEDTKKLMSNIKDDKEYWNYVDCLCEAMDKTGMFADEVFSINIVD